MTLDSKHVFVLGLFCYEGNHMFKLFKHRNEIKIEAPCRGKVMSLDHSQDETFRTRTLGEGCFIQPADNKIYAPVDGKVISVFPTKHAFGIETKEGIQLMIHIGIDTVYLNGQYIVSSLNANERIYRGDVIAEFEPQKITQAGYNPDVYLFILERKGYSVSVLKENEMVEEGDCIIRCIREEE